MPARRTRRPRKTAKRWQNLIEVLGKIATNPMTRPTKTATMTTRSRRPRAKQVTNQGRHCTTAIQRANPIGSALARGGRNPNEADSSGITLLMVAATGSREIVDLLIRKGASVDRALADGKSALFVAVASGNEPAPRSCSMRARVSRSAIRFRLNDVEVGGCSPLYVAAMLGRPGRAGCCSDAARHRVCQ